MQKRRLALAALPPRLLLQLRAWRRKYPMAFAGLLATVGVIFSVGLGWQAVKGVDWRETLHGLAEASPLYGLAALGTFLASNWLRALRWRFLFAQGPPPVWRLFLVQNTGIGMNNLMPVRIFSEPVQYALLVDRDKVPPGTAVATLGMERVLDFQATFIVLAAATLAVPEMQGHGATWPILGLALLFTVGSTLGLHLVGWASKRFAWARSWAFLAQTGQAVLQMENRLPALCLSLTLSIGTWVAHGATAWLLGRGLDIPLGFPAALVLVVLVTFVSTVVPGFVGGIGVFEFAATGVLVLFFNVDRDLGLSFALLIHALWFLPPVLVAMVMLPLEGIAALRALRQAPPPTG